MSTSNELFTKQIQEALRAPGGIDIPAKPAAPAAPEAAPADAPKDAPKDAAVPAAPSEDILTSAMKLAKENNAKFLNMGVDQLKMYGVKKSTLAKAKEFIAKNEKLSKLDPKEKIVIRNALAIKMADPAMAQAAPEAQATPEEPKEAGKQPGEEKMTMVGAARKAITVANETKDPAEAEQKAQAAIKKAGLKENLEYYEDMIYDWIAKLPIVGRWFGSKSKTMQRIIVLVTIAVVATLVTLGVKWAKDLMAEKEAADKQMAANAKPISKREVEYTTDKRATKNMSDDQKDHYYRARDKMDMTAEERNEEVNRLAMRKFRTNKITTHGNIGDGSDPEDVKVFDTPKGRVAARLVPDPAGPKGSTKYEWISQKDQPNKFQRVAGDTVDAYEEMGKTMQAASQPNMGG